MDRYFNNYLIVSIFVLAGLVAFLFFVKNKVTALHRNIASVNSEILMEKESIHILKAEQSYLANPKRVKKLVEKNLDLQVPLKEQILNQESLETWVSIANTEHERKVLEEQMRIAEEEAKKLAELVAAQNLANASPTVEEGKP